MGRPPIHPYLPLVQPLMESLMGAEKKRLNKCKLDLIRKNQAHGGKEIGFYYLDMRCAAADQRFQNGEGLPYVQPALREEAQELYDEIKRVDSHEQRLRQALSVVLPKCRTLQDIRDVLPEVFIREVPQLQGLERMRPEGFILDEYPMLKPQYLKAVEIAEYYTVNKLLF